MLYGCKLIFLSCLSWRWNLTANAARPNPQGSFHYGKITTTRTFVFANSAPLINGNLRYAVNRISYIDSDTPLKLADYFNISGVFDMNSIQSVPSEGPASLATSVVPVSLHDFVEVVFQNNENAIQSWHLDGYDFWVVGWVTILCLSFMTLAENQLYKTTEISGESHSFYATRFKDGPYFAD